jgi:hypothetical protein
MAPARRETGRKKLNAPHPVIATPAKAEGALTSRRVIHFAGISVIGLGEVRLKQLLFFKKEPLACFARLNINQSR